MAEKQKKVCGFALLSAARRREIASQGGKAVQKSGKAHQWTPITASEAGRKGGTEKQRQWRERNGVSEPSA